MSTVEQPFTAADDGVHEPGDTFYDTETFWFSFFVPERSMGAWLYTSLRKRAGVSAGGMWIWDDTAVEPWHLPFFEQFSWLKLPDDHGPEKLSFANGMTVAVREPLMSYDLGYDDRDRAKVQLRFDALEPPIPLRSGAPPYPQAHHFDQTGHVTGTVRLDGEDIAVDCYAMRDRSWGRRNERGYTRIGYVWAAAPEVTFLAYSLPTGPRDDVSTGYLRMGDEVARLTGGVRRVERDPARNWVTAMEIEAVDEHGRPLRARGEALSRMVLPGSTSICINTAMRWDIDGQVVHGEDQDVWPIKEFRARP